MDLQSVYKHKIILGSASPRRQQLLRDAAFTIDVQPINADESFPSHLKAEQIALFLCEKKAKAFTKQLSDEEILITSDTIVWIGGIVLNTNAAILIW